MNPVAIRLLNQQLVAPQPSFFIGNHATDLQEEWQRYLSSRNSQIARSGLC